MECNDGTDDGGPLSGTLNDGVRWNGWLDKSITTSAWKREELIQRSAGKMDGKIDGTKTGRVKFNDGTELGDMEYAVSCLDG